MAEGGIPKEAVNRASVKLPTKLEAIWAVRSELWQRHRCGSAGNISF